MAEHFDSIADMDSYNRYQWCKALSVPGSEDYKTLAKWFNGQRIHNGEPIPRLHEFNFHLEGEKGYFASQTERWLCNALNRVIYRNPYRLGMSSNGKEPFRFAAGYTESMKFGAQAVTYNGVDLIGLSLKLVLFLRSYYFCCFSHPDFMPHIAEISAKNPQQFAIPVVYEELNDNYSVEPPHDLYRTDACDCMLHYTLMFIFEHEFTHIYEGHLDYTIAVQNEKRSLTWIEQHVLEYDAERVAMNRVFQSASGTNYLTLNGGLPHLVARRPQNIYLATFSIYTVLRVMAQSIDSKEITNGSHPTHLTRIDLLITYYRNLTQSLSYNDGNLSGFMNKAIHDAEIMYRRIFNSKAIYRSGMEHDARAYIELIEYHFQELLPSLMIFRRSIYKKRNFLPTPPPIEDDDRIPVFYRR